MNDEQITTTVQNELIEERYQVLAKIGEDRTATLYKVADTKRDNAILMLKLLSREPFLRNLDIVARFTNEYEVGRKLAHPNIVKFYNCGRLEISHPNIVKFFNGDRLENGAYFIAMEYIAGQSLSSRIRDRDHPLRFPEVMSLLRSIATGIHYMHSQDIVHRNLKSDNVMLTANGDVKIIGLELARRMLGTRPGEAVYASPEEIELWRGDSRIDIYALGITAFELATGRLPFHCDSTRYEAMVLKQIAQPIPNLTKNNLDIPLWFQEFIEACTTQKVEDQYRSMDQVMNELGERE